MSIKKLYYYFFYKIYKTIDYTSDASGGKFMTSFKTGIVIIALEFWLTIAILNYYNVFFDKTINFSKGVYVIIALFFSVLSYITIDYNKVWKSYYVEFDKLPTKKNKAGGWVVFGISAFIIAFFVYSIYLMSQINWILYR